MEDSRQIQENSHKDIMLLLEDAYQSALFKAESEEQEKIVNQLGDLLEALATEYDQVIEKYKLLTYVYRQVTQENLKSISTDIKTTLDSLSIEPSELREITSNKISEIEKEKTMHSQSLTKINEQLGIELGAFRKTWEEKISRTRQILQIPDLAKALKGKENLLSCIANIEEHFEEFLDFPSQELETRKIEWSALVKKFGKFKSIESYEGIKRGYKFSDETIEIIKKLLDEEEIPLSSINPQVLKEITKFSDFCAVVKMRYQPEVENKNNGI